ncbi:hypothetical protein [Microseira wollei]|nr:hypothetical protein [Microseira wollei]
MQRWEKKTLKSDSSPRGQALWSPFLAKSSATGIEFGFTYT